MISGSNPYTFTLGSFGSSYALTSTSVSLCGSTSPSTTSWTSSTSWVSSMASPGLGGLVTVTTSWMMGTGAPSNVVGLWCNQTNYGNYANDYNTDGYGTIQCNVIYTLNGY